jgi:hypothetical protein
VKRLETEIKNMGEKMALESRGKMNEDGQMEKKLTELIESEKRLN